MNQFKSELKYFRFYRIRYIVLIIFIVTSFLLITLPFIHSFFNLLLQDSIQQSLSKINNINNFILALLTLVLVLITGFYAWVTFRMFKEQSEKRKLEISPNIFIKVIDPEFTLDKSQVNRITTLKFYIANYGQGTAVNARLEFSIPHNKNSETGKLEYVSASYEGIHPFFQTNNSKEDTKKIITTIYDIQELTEEFLIISLYYEDIQRNLYTIRQYYDMRRISLSKNPNTYYLILRSELAYFTSFRNRGSMGFDRTFTTVSEKSKLLWKLSNR